MQNLLTRISETIFQIIKPLFILTQCSDFITPENTKKTFGFQSLNVFTKGPF